MNANDELNLKSMEYNYVYQWYIWYQQLVDLSGDIILLFIINLDLIRKKVTLIEYGRPNVGHRRDPISKEITVTHETKINIKHLSADDTPRWAIVVNYIPNA